MSKLYREIVHARLRNTQVDIRVGRIQLLTIPLEYKLKDIVEWLQQREVE